MAESQSKRSRSRKSSRAGRARNANQKSKTHLKKVEKKRALPIRMWRAVKRWFSCQKTRNRDWLKRRPHRSFYLTKKRDSARSLKMPGYIAFSNQVFGMIKKNKGLFLRFFLLYGVLSAILVGMLSQENYTALRDALNGVGEDLGISKWLSLFAGAVTGSAGSSSTEIQQFLSVVLLLFGWLTMVWLLRALMAGHKVKLRDGLYSAGSPILATAVIVVVILLQILPFALSLLAYSALGSVGIINSGIAIENMAAWCALAVIGALTLYWLTSSFIGLVIVTLPGMYPFRALKAAGDMVVGRRLRLMYRLIFMILPMLVMWLVVLIPVILLDDALKIAWLPLVPLFVLLLSTLTLMWVVTYIYMLYRRIVDDEAKPAKR